MMHVEFLIEDASGKLFLDQILPVILNEGVTWRVHGYKGIGRIPKNLSGKADPSKRILLDQLPRLLAGYGRTPYVDAVVVVVDSDDRDPAAFLGELEALLAGIAGPPAVLFRLATEEMEAWYFGDQAAVRAAYPHANQAVMAAYVQDSVCGTWERLADAIAPGGSARVIAEGWPAPGVLKAEWASTIPPCMNVNANVSPSFNGFLEGVRSLAPA